MPAVFVFLGVVPALLWLRHGSVALSYMFSVLAVMEAGLLAFCIWGCVRVFQYTTPGGSLLTAKCSDPVKSVSKPRGVSPRAAACAGAARCALPRPRHRSLLRAPAILTGCRHGRARAAAVHRGGGVDVSGVVPGRFVPRRRQRGVCGPAHSRAQAQHEHHVVKRTLVVAGDAAGAVAAEDEAPKRWGSRPGAGANRPRSEGELWMRGQGGLRDLVMCRQGLRSLVARGGTFCLQSPRATQLPHKSPRPDRAAPTGDRTRHRIEWNSRHPRTRPLREGQASPAAHAAGPFGNGPAAVRWQPARPPRGLAPEKRPLS